MNNQIMLTTTNDVCDDDDEARKTSETIREHNDLVRSRLVCQKGADEIEVPFSCVFTRGVRDTIQDTDELLNIISSYSDFCEANDPYQEHDVGFFDFEQQKIMFKIDYYAIGNMGTGSENPGDPLVTHRVLTVLLRSEY